ncbi:MAG TPA: hypothetical protein VK358_08485, partial [Longimicrobium sp.]|nr:hypothetical protein [Longimicrobium sp.]
MSQLQSRAKTRDADAPPQFPLRVGGIDVGSNAIRFLAAEFASPEQLRGDRNLTAASDVFSLGVVGYQLLTG